MINTINTNNNVLFYLNHRKDFNEFIQKIPNLFIFEQNEIETIFDYKFFLINNQKKIINFKQKINKINKSINEIKKILNNGFFNQMENIIVNVPILNKLKLKKYLIMLTYIDYKEIKKTNFFIDYNNKKIRQNQFNEFYKKNEKLFEGNYEDERLFSSFIKIIFKYIYYTNITTTEEKIDFKANITIVDNIFIMFLIKNFPFGYLENKVIKILDIDFSTNYSTSRRLQVMIKQKISKVPLLVENFIELKSLINRVEVSKLKNSSDFFELYIDESNEDLVEYIKNYLDNKNKIIRQKDI